MFIAQPGFHLLVAFGHEALAVRAAPPNAPVFQRAPARRKAGRFDRRRQIVVEDRLQHGPDLVRRLARNVEVCLSGTFDEHISMLDADRLAGQPHQALDEIGGGLAGKLEDHHVPALRFAQLIDKLAHQYPIAFHGMVFFRAGTPLHGVAAHGTNRSLDPVLLPAQSTRAIVHLLAGADLELVAAFFASDLLVSAQQGRGHRAGRDHEGLGLEGAEQEGQNQCYRHRFDHLAHRPRRGKPPGHLIHLCLRRGSRWRGLAPLCLAFRLALLASVHGPFGFPVLPRVASPPRLSPFSGQLPPRPREAISLGPVRARRVPHPPHGHATFLPHGGGKSRPIFSAAGWAIERGADYRIYRNRPGSGMWNVQPPQTTRRGAYTTINGLPTSRLSFTAGPAVQLRLSSETGLLSPST